MKYDYIAREGRYEEEHDGREDGGRGEVRHMESGNMPEWAADRPRSYWEAADVHERANGRLFREIHVALPAELSRARQKELLVDRAGVPLPPGPGGSGVPAIGSLPSWRPTASPVNRIDLPAYSSRRTILPALRASDRDAQSPEPGKSAS